MNKLRLAGWVLSGLIVCLLAASATAKLVPWEGKEANFGKLGFSLDVMWVMGLIELAIAAAFLVPRTAFVGALFLTAYLGGATAAHVRVGDVFAVPVVMGTLVWAAMLMRNPRLWAFVLGKSRPQA